MVAGALGGSCVHFESFFFLMVGGPLTGVLRVMGVAVDLGGISGNYSNLGFVGPGLFAVCKLLRNF